MRQKEILIAPSAKWVPVGLGVQKPVAGRGVVASGEVTGCASRPRALPRVSPAPSSSLQVAVSSIPPRRCIERGEPEPKADVLSPALVSGELIDDIPYEIGWADGLVLCMYPCGSRGSFRTPLDSELAFVRAIPTPSSSIICVD